jgi:hypothetical protein
MLARILMIAGLVATGLLLILVTTVTPNSAGAVGILAVFLLSYTVIVCLLTFLIWLSARLVSKMGKEIRVFRKDYSISLKKSYYYSSVISLGPVIVISLQSVGGVGIYEMALVVVFIALGCLYIVRRTA